MRRPFVADDLFGLLHVLHFLFEGFQSFHEPGNILLLPEELPVELGDRFVLQGGQGFELDHSFFHAFTVADSGSMGSCLIAFCVDAAEPFA